MGCVSSAPTETQQLQKITFTDSGLWQIKDVDVLIVPANESLREDNILNNGMDQAIGNSMLQIVGENSIIQDDDSDWKTYLVNSTSGDLKKNNRINWLYHYVRKGQFSQTSTSSIMLKRHLSTMYQLLNLDLTNVKLIITKVQLFLLLLPGTDSISTLECANIYKSVIQKQSCFTKISILCEQNNLVEFKKQYQCKGQANTSMQQQQPSQKPFMASQPINQETSSAIQTLESNVTPKLKIIVEHENIVNLRNVDAIVNSANSNLFESAGLCGDIYTACGSQELDQRCMEYREQYGPVQTSQVAVTGSCNLVQQKIISILHAVGPKNSKSANSEKELHNCLINIFVKLKYASIAIPAIASGSKGFGKLKCAQIFLNAIQKFRNEHCEIEGLVRLTNKDQVTYESFIEVFRDYL